MVERRIEQRRKIALANGRQALPDSRDVKPDWVPVRLASFRRKRLSRPLGPDADPAQVAYGVPRVAAMCHVLQTCSAELLNTFSYFDRLKRLLICGFSVRFRGGSYPTPSISCDERISRAENTLRVVAQIANLRVVISNDANLFSLRHIAAIGDTSFELAVAT
jgi:hypothetical protein